MFIPKALYIWLVLSSFVVLYDATYVLLRPATMEGGSLFPYFTGYAIYIKFDTLYANLTDTFVVIQSWLNLAEITLILGSVLLSLSSCKIKKLIGALLIVIGSAFVFWKTVIYLWYSHDFTTEAVKKLTTDALLCFVLPSSFWIIFPVLTMYYVSKNIVNYVRSTLQKPNEKPKRA